jgi:hypothetical protein
MSVSSYIFGIAVAVVILVAVVELLRRRLLRERHAIWWLVAGVAALVFGLFPPALNWVSRLLGVEIPTNLIFFLSIATLFLVGLQHSAELTRLESKTRTLAEQIALQELRLRRLEEQGGERARD